MKQRCHKGYKQVLYIKYIYANKNWNYTKMHKKLEKVPKKQKMYFDQIVGAQALVSTTKQTGATW